MLVDFVSTENIFSAIFDFHFRKNSHFCDEFQALITLSEKVKRKSRVSDQIRIIISTMIYIVETYHSGRKPSKYKWQNIAEVNGAYKHGTYEKNCFKTL